MNPTFAFTQSASPVGDADYTNTILKSSVSLLAAGKLSRVTLRGVKFPELHRGD